MTSTTFLFGVLPVLAFVILESISGKRSALIIALILAASELVFSLVSYGRIDELTILAFVLVAFAVAMSLKTGNDVYFKLQPCAQDLLFAVAFLVFYFILSQPLMNFVFHKYAKAIAPEMFAAIQSDFFEEVLRILSRDLPFWFLLHAILTGYAALRLSKWWWLAFRVPGFYVLLFLATRVAASMASHRLYGE